VDGTHAKAIVNPFLDLGCGFFESGETSGHGTRGARLVARTGSKERALFLQVNKNHRNAAVRVEASLEERRNGLTIDREVVHHYPATALRFDPLLQSATFDPPAPFSGSAKFRRDAKPAKRWAGNLSIDFPGRANVHLAGRRFKATLAHAKRTEETVRYDRLSSR
jgi:hypothetical protein